MHEGANRACHTKSTDSHASTPQVIICLNERKEVSSIHINHPLNCLDTDAMVPVGEVTFYTVLWLHSILKTKMFAFFFFL